MTIFNRNDPEDGSGADGDADVDAGADDPADEDLPLEFDPEELIDIDPEQFVDLSIDPEEIVDLDSEDLEELRGRYNAVVQTLGGREDSEGDAAAPPEELAALRETCSEIVRALRDRRFGVEAREDVAGAIEDALVAAARVTTAQLECPVPENVPPTRVLVDCMSGLSGALVTEHLAEDVDADAIANLQAALERAREQIEAAPEFPYEYEELGVDSRAGKRVIAHGLREGNEEVFAGPYARELMDNAENDPDQPLWLGVGTRDGRDASIQKQFLFRHLGIWGVTGYGKSTLLKNAFRQLAVAGYGGCFVDPKGDDSRELLQILPEERLDDVVWIEPGSSREYVSGFNFLRLEVDPDEAGYETALEALVSDLAKLVGATDVWGPRLDRVVRGLVRGMHAADREFTLVDLYHVLGDESTRENFVATLAEDGVDVADHAAQIDGIDDDRLATVLDRFRPWVETPLARRLVSLRGSPVSIPEAVEQGKIVVVRMSAESKDTKRMLGMAVVRRIWATIRARADTAESNRDPFYLFVDEFDNIALNDETILSMLSESRSYRLALTFCCQYPGQLPEEVVEGMLVNCDTLLSFNPGSQEQAKYVAPKLDLDRQTLLNESNFHVWMRVTLDRNMERSDAFRVYTYPPYPPVRTATVADDWIEAHLREYGRPKGDRTGEALPFGRNPELVEDHGAS